MKDKRLHNVKKVMLYTASSYFLLSVQLILAPYARVLGVMAWLPPTMLGCVLTLEEGFSVTLLYAALLGTWSDVYMHSILLFTVLYPLIALIMRRYAAYFSVRRLVWVLALSAGISVLGQLLYITILLLVPARANISLLWTRLPMELSLSLVGLLVVYPLFWRIALCRK